MKLSNLLLFIILSITFSVSIYAQPAQIKEIRNIYQIAQQNAKTADKIVIDRQRNLCATGPSHKKVEIFLNAKRKPFFIRESFNLAARTFYHEYLFDKQDKPLFFYIKSNTADKMQEERIYFLSNGTSYTLPETLSQKNSQYGTQYKELFNNYQQLVTQLENLDNYQESKHQHRGMITPEQAKNNSYIKNIDKLTDDIQKHIELSKDEIHMEHYVKILHTSDNKTDKKQLHFVFADDSECGDTKYKDRVQFVKIDEDFESFNSSVAQQSEHFVFDKFPEHLQKFYQSESHEGSSGEIYFLPDNKLYCIGEERVLENDGSFIQKPVACNANTKNIIIFTPDYKYAQDQANRLIKIFHQFSQMDLMMIGY